jgi:aminoglycoside phosphotransferase (APT) family kinase protein
MMGAGWFTKQRPILDPSASRLLREQACAEYAQRVVSPSVKGVRIVFPRTVTSYGYRISVRTQAIEGESLLSMLYQPALRERAVEMGLVALEALYGVDVASLRFTAFGALYRFGKGPLAALQTLLGTPQIARVEQRQLLRLALSYFARDGTDAVLVHGDLHASHIIIDRAANTLGFIDLEAMHRGNPATDFAHLWTGYHYANAALGHQFYQRHQDQFPHLATDRFDADTRFELALRARKHIGEATRLRNSELKEKATALLHGVLQRVTFEEACLDGSLG